MGSEIPFTPDSCGERFLPSQSLHSGVFLTSSASSSRGTMNAKARNFYSRSSLTSVGSVANSEISLGSETGSSFSQTSSLQSQRSIDQSQATMQSQVSVQSQVSIASQSSLQSELSLLSQSSLGFLPSIGNFSSDGKEAAVAEDYRCVSTLQGHDGHVSAIVLAGEHLYSASGSQNIRVWCKADLVEHCTFGSGQGAAKALVVDGDKIFSAHQDHKIRVWKKSKNELGVHKLIATLPTMKDYLMTCIPPKNYVQVRRHHKKIWIQHVDTISALAVAKNNLLYSASWDRTVKVWRLSDFRCLESFKAHDDAINALVVSEDGFVYTGSADAKIIVWAKLNSGKKHSLVTTMESHKSAVNALALSPEGSLLYSGACDRAIIAWEREDSAQHMGVVGALRGHRHAILCLATVGDTLCSGSADKTIRVWRRGVGRLHSCVAVLHGHRGPVKCLTITMNKTMELMVYSGSLDQDIKFWWIGRSQDDRSGTAWQQQQIMTQIFEGEHLL